MCHNNCLEAISKADRKEHVVKRKPSGRERKGKWTEGSKAIGHSARGCVVLKDPRVNRGQAKSKTKRENEILDDDDDK